MSLDRYRQKRRFSRTPEPLGRERQRGAGGLFVVQKHQARRLHYDVRLELGGVLKSWATPKGPSLDPHEKRLAVHVEDHPLEYGDFEGVIPAGQYGAGAVLLWDRGRWQSVGDAAAGYRQGKLKLRLEGEKLQGGWTLVRMRARAGEQGDNWLLIKERDEHARSLSEYDVLEERPESVASGRSLSQIAAAAKDERKQGGKPKAKKKQGRARKVNISGASKAAMPQQFKLQLASPSAEAPPGERWLHEIKLDGYRLLCRLDRGEAKLFTRGGHDWTHRFPELAQAAGQLHLCQAALDGEAVVLLESGASSFQALQEALSSGETGAVVYYAFDLLYLDGYDLRRAALWERKRLLAELLADASSSRLQYVDHLEGEGPEFFRQCCRMGLEGIISKRRDRPYRAGRRPDWLKIKCIEKEEFVIGGYTRPTAASRKGLGALLVGYYSPAGELVYAGRVGTGFSESLLLDLRGRLSSLETKDCPFAELPSKEIDRSVRWVRPQLIAQVEFSNWTREGLLRHPSFQGLREDLGPKSIVREPVAAPKKSSPKKKSKTKQPSKSKRSQTRPAPRRTGLSPQQLDQLAGLRLTNADRVLYPEQGLTKLGLATYYAEIAPWILPHVVDRPVSFLRCPEGRGGECFFQKHAAAGTPEALGRVRITEKEKEREYLVIRDLAGLVSTVQMGVLEIHLWGARTDRIERPDRVVFDLDPDPELPWARVIEAALEVREFLQELGLASFVKTTGGKGLHVVAPIQRRHEWPEVKAFSQQVARELAKAAPRRYTASMSKQARRGRIYLDYLRNGRGATAIAPYSTRARSGAPVAAPLAWEELTPAIGPDHFRVDNLPSRLAALEEDPWAEMGSLRQSITAKAKKRLGL